MKERKTILSGSRVRSELTGEFGIVVEVIGDPLEPFGYVVQTSTGPKRWILKRGSVVKPNSKPS